ncbi:MAG TPA: alpha/beta fold hydrolase, partial [Flavobacteriaceae bacterium]|nr:alpha/beta fold hydrolase [Flavobacteriaceae bacterium]
MDQLNEIKIIDFKTESGEIIPSINLSYQLFGKQLGDAPIILVNHALTGNSNLTGKNGWWKEVIGKDKAINTKKFSIISFNIPGNGFCSNDFYSPNKFHLGDIANLFILAIEKLKIKKLHSIIGG